MEQYSFHCPACGVERTASLSIVGRRVRCPLCEATVIAPSPESEREQLLKNTWAPEPPPSSPAPTEAAVNAPPFDPYYKWLAIPSGEQPPNHYRLLGLPLYEEDREVIESSADRQMAHVKTQAGGRRAEISQRLLNELANACSCLMSPKKKRAYDKQLRKELAEKSEAAPTKTEQTNAAESQLAAPSTDAPQVLDEIAPKVAPDAPQETQISSPSARGEIRPTAEAAEGKSRPSKTNLSGPSKKSGQEKKAAAAKKKSGSRKRPPEAVVSPPVQAVVESPPVQTPHAVEPPEDESADPADDGPIVFHKDRDRPESDMDMTPMVDVVFLLLIFFMVTAAFALQRSKELPIPRDDQPSTAAQSIEDFEEDPDVVIVRVDAYNSYHVTTPDWEEEAPSEQELLIKLREARQGDSAGNVPNQLLVIANGEAMYERVVKALDAGPAVGMESVKMLTVEEDEE